LSNGTGGNDLNDTAKKQNRRTILGFSLLFGFGATAATTAQAQGLNARLNLTQQDRYQQDRYQQDRYQQDRYQRDRDYDRDRDQNRGRGRRHGRNNDGYPNLGGTFQLRQTALNAGYNEGIKEGRNDRRRNRTSDFRSFNPSEGPTRTTIGVMEIRNCTDAISNGL